LLSTFLGHDAPASTFWYLHAAPELLALAAQRLENGHDDPRPILEAFFTDRLMTQRQTSPHTVAAYRDTFTLLLGYTLGHTGKHPAQLDISDLDAPLIGAFLQHLETDRGNSVTTRNARLAAIHSLFRYAALRAPEHAALIARVLAIPNKRQHRPLVCFLTRDEIEALLAAPDPTHWTGRRDHTLLLVLTQTGLRVSD
jgi:integrase/recombinase XerD